LSKDQVIIIQFRLFEN